MWWNAGGLRKIDLVMQKKFPGQTSEMCDVLGRKSRITHYNLKKIVGFHSHGTNTLSTISWHNTLEYCENHLRLANLWPVMTGVAKAHATHNITHTHTHTFVLPFLWEVTCRLYLPNTQVLEILCWWKLFTLHLIYTLSSHPAIAQ